MDKDEVRRGEEDNEEEKCESNEEDNEKEEAPGRWTFAKQLGGHRLFLKRVEGTVNRARVVPGPRREGRVGRKTGKRPWPDFKTG